MSNWEGVGGKVWKKKWDVIKRSGECNLGCLVSRTGLKRPGNGGTDGVRGHVGRAVHVSLTSEALEALWAWGI